jgi:hypothetical protein
MLFLMQFKGIFLINPGQIRGDHTNINTPADQGYFDAQIHQLVKQITYAQKGKKSSQKLDLPHGYD